LCPLGGGLAVRGCTYETLLDLRRYVTSWSLSGSSLFLSGLPMGPDYDASMAIRPAGGHLDLGLRHRVISSGSLVSRKPKNHFCRRPQKDGFVPGPAPGRGRENPSQARPPAPYTRFSRTDATGACAFERRR